MNEKNIEQGLAKILSESSSAPFLFIGSGFSRRYIDLPDWKGLLQRFSTVPFVKYLGKVNDDTPLAASALAEVYYEEWWDNSSGKEHIYNSQGWSKQIDLPLKYDISDYLGSYPITKEMLDHPELIELRNEKVVIDGIITTNWDLLLEEIFPNLKVYVGQSDILFKQPQAIGEIFKIHGCCTNYHSLILTSKDYEGFNKKNPYLASKLISIFLEKPVIFIGYSMSDKNIAEILEVIETVIDSEEKIAKLAKNMIFVDRPDGRDEAITKLMKVINGRSIQFTNVITDDFGKVYRALQYAERKIPVEFLRIFKEQIYNIVNSKDKADLRLKAIDFDSILEGDDIEFVAGVGVASNSNFREIGMFGITTIHLLKDIIFDDIPCSKKEVETLIPLLVKTNPVYLPIRKYINSNNYNLNTISEVNLKTRLEMSASSFIGKITGQEAILLRIGSVTDPQDIVQIYNDNFNRLFNALALWLNSNPTPDNCELIRELIKSNYGDWLEKLNNSCFRRLICILDEFENNSP